VQRLRPAIYGRFGSVRAVQQADAAALSAVVTGGQAGAIRKHFDGHG
jgi:hypothetical protein